MEFEGRTRVSEQLSIAPLIDVVFLLLLFFMVTSSFQHPEAIELDLPQSSTAVADEDRAVDVSVDAAGSTHVDGKLVALADLEGAIAERVAADPEVVVAVRTDAGALVQRMVEVLDAVRSGGGKRIAFRTSPSGGFPDSLPSLPASPSALPVGPPAPGAAGDPSSTGVAP
ncbi:MAG: ExbD/TolR family protein [Candidatus Binatia bacterium]